MSSPKIVKEDLANDKNSLLDWWVGTVFFTFFPLISLSLISLCTKGTIDFYRLFGDGELILSAFLVSTTSLLKLHNNGVTDALGKRLFYALLITESLQLVAYTSIKMATERKAIVVYIASAFCVLASILISRASEKHLCKEG